MMHHGATTLLISAASALVLTLSTGCRAIHAPALPVSSLITIAPDATVSTAEPDPTWPSRWGNDPDTRGIIIEMDPTDRLRSVHYSRYHQGRTKPADYDDASQLAAAIGIETAFNFKVEGPGSFIFTTDTLSDEPLKDPPDLTFRYVSATETAESNAAFKDNKDHVKLQRTWFTYRDPKQSAEPQGTLVILPGMFGTPEPIVNATERYFASKGYAIIRMLSHPSRYTEHLMLEYFEGQAENIAIRAARTADDRVAECAYATDAALDYVQAQRPDLADQPIVLLGMSGGAMALPSVYTYNPDRYDAAVLIAGGANFLKIMIESNYRSWIDAILVDFDPASDGLGKPDPGVVDTLSALYLQHAKLDAYHSAPKMHDLPVLVLHANTDKAVPAKSGDLLYQRLGSPERWTYPLGHELIFAGLPTQIPRIEKWVAEQLNASSSESGG